MAMAIIAANAVALAAQPIWIEINQSYLYQAGYSPITRVTVANPAIADVVVLDRTKLNIVGKALGSTSLSVWRVACVSPNSSLPASSMPPSIPSMSSTPQNATTTAMAQRGFTENPRTFFRH